MNRGSDIVERDLTRVEQALHDGSFIFAADAVRTVVDEMKRLQACLHLKENEIAWLRGEISNLGCAIHDMPMRNNGGDLVRWRQWAIATCRHALGLSERENDRVTEK